MIIYSTYLKAIFWIVMGLIYALMIVAAPIWARDLGLDMNWWKWSLAAVWYGLLSIGIAASFTLMGEKEPGAGHYFLAVTLVAMAILGVSVVPPMN